MEKLEKAVEVAQNKEVQIGKSPADMILMAVQGGADLEKLEKLMILQERWEANEAKKAYNEALARFKENPPEIEKDKTVAYKEVKYSHASLANVVKKISSELSKYGLSVSWRTSQENGGITVTCKLAHMKGHSEETSITASPDMTGSKNSIQAIGSTISYLERYTLLALTGLATQDMDDDTKNVEVVYLTDEQQSELADLMADAEVDANKFFKHFGAEGLTKFPASEFSRAKIAIETKKKKNAAKEIK